MYFQLYRRLFKIFYFICKWFFYFSQYFLDKVITHHVQFLLLSSFWLWYYSFSIERWPRHHEAIFFIILTNLLVKRNDIIKSPLRIYNLVTYFTYFSVYNLSQWLLPVECGLCGLLSIFKSAMFTSSSQ